MVPLLEQSDGHHAPPCVSIADRQVILFRLRTGHNDERPHVYKAQGHADICPRDTAPVTGQHLLAGLSSPRCHQARKHARRTLLWWTSCIVETFIVARRRTAAFIRATYRCARLAIDNKTERRIQSLEINHPAVPGDRSWKGWLGPLSDISPAP